MAFTGNACRRGLSGLSVEMKTAGADKAKKAPEGAVDRQRFGMAFYRASTMASSFRTPALEKSLVCIDHRFRIVVEPASIHQVEHPIHIKIAIAHVLP